MKKRFVAKILLLTTVAILPVYGAGAEESAQPEEAQPVVLPPLFDYPVAPEEMDWNQRSEWLVEHFWDNFDFKQPSVGQQQLNHAFNTWMLPVIYADRNISYEAVTNLLKKLEKNPTLLIQFVRAADYCVYDPATAQFLADGVYLKFLKALAANKKVRNTYKIRYALHQKRLENTEVGKPIPEFSYMSREGVMRKFTPEGRISIVEFGDPACPDCQITRISLQNEEHIKDGIEKGYIDLYFIIPDADISDDSWKEDVSIYSENWIVGAAEGVDDIIDIRVSPSLFLFDRQGNLVLKNSGLGEIYNAVADIESRNDAGSDNHSGSEASE